MPSRCCQIPVRNAWNKHLHAPEIVKPGQECEALKKKKKKREHYLEEVSGVVLREFEAARRSLTKEHRHARPHHHLSNDTQLG